MHGPAFEALPGRKLEKMKENKAERSKRFFSPCARVLKQEQSLLFLSTIRLQLLFLLQVKLFKDLVAKGHSSFNKFVSLDHSPVTGAAVNPSLCVSGIQSDLVTEAFSDPSFVSQVRGLEAMLRVRECVGPAAFETDSNCLSSELGTGGHDASLRPVAAGSEILTNKCDLELDTVFKSALQRSLLDPEAGVSEGALLEKSSSLNSRIGRLDSSLSAHVSSHARARASSTVSCLARPAVVAAVASPVVSRARSYAQVAAAACDDAVALHDSFLCSRNSGGTGGLLLVQRSTSYCLDNSRLGSNSRRKVRQSSTIASRSVVQTVDMSPAPAAGTYRRSADKVHDQRQVSRKCLAESSRGGPGPGPGPVEESEAYAAASLEIPCSLVMPPGRHQHAPQSLDWARVCGSGKSGVWVLKGDARTYNLHRNLDDVGVVWEHASGYETAWATPGHDCSCSYDYGRGPVLPQANPSVFTEAVHL